ncbi:MAG: insulinase family protein [Krumholzibacteria bacterium]|nr:insulinase family protein [Candidatus Krumholzibacteria bacterium]
MENVKRGLGLLALALLLTGTVTADAEAKKPWEKIRIPELNEIRMPEYRRVELDNGMIVYLAEDHEFPLLELSATIEVGSIYEPADKLGLAEMTGSVMRTGGTTGRDGDAIDELVEARGLAVETWIGQNSGGAYVSALAGDTDLGLELLADILRNPAFPEDKIKLAKEEQKASISRRNDDPMTIAQREAMKAVYGADHPLARHPEYDTIAAVTRDDMLAFHRQWFHPDRMYLVVIGAFDSADMIGRLERVFAGWEPVGTDLPADPEILDLPRTVNIVDKDDLTQSTILLGHKGIRADSPHYAGVMVGNRILGGGFSTRLFNEIRSRQGLAYSVGSSAGTGWRNPGLFMAFTMTKSESSEKATDAILAEIDKMITAEVTDEELAQAKDGILNSEVFNYDTKRKILDRMVMFERFGYPADFLQTYQEQVRTMTKADVLAATQAVWHPDRMTIFAVGNYADWDGDFAKYGPVTMVDITIPEPSLDIPEATPASLEQGMALMKAAREAAGGKRLIAMKSYFEKTKLDATIQGMALTFTTEKTVVYPDRSHTLVKTPFGNQTMVLAGDKAWATGPMGARDLEGDDLANAKEELSSDVVGIFRGLDKLTCQALEPREIEGTACLPVYVTGFGDGYQIFFLDEATKQVRMVQQPGVSPMTQAPVVQKVYVDEYAEMDGLPMPRKLRLMYDDELFGTATVEAWDADPKVDMALFNR